MAARAWWARRQDAISIEEAQVRAIVEEAFVLAHGLAPAGRLPEVQRLEVSLWFRDLTAITSETLLAHATWHYRLDRDGSWYHTAPLQAAMPTPTGPILPENPTAVVVSQRAGPRIRVHPFSLEPAQAFFQWSSRPGSLIVINRLEMPTIQTF